MNNRIFAIDFNKCTDVDGVKTFVEQIKQYDICDDIYVFSNTIISEFDGLCQVVVFDESATNAAMKKNCITEFFRNKNFTGFLHVVESNIQLLKDQLRTQLKQNI